MRDLGELRLVAGGETRRGRVVRADCIASLSSAGIAALRRDGVVRIVDLRADGVELVRAPILPGHPDATAWVMAEVLAWLERTYGGGRGDLLTAGLAAPALGAAVGRLV